jgi:hypothetical protein
LPRSFATRKAGTYDSDVGWNRRRDHAAERSAIEPTWGARNSRARFQRHRAVLVGPRQDVMHLADLEERGAVKSRPAQHK